jgi:Flp pilus assembly protein TadD
MALKLYRCMNIGNGCSNADSTKIFELPDLGNPVCPECNAANVIAVRPKGALGSRSLIVVGALAVGLSGVAGYSLWPSAKANNAPPTRRTNLDSSQVRAAFEVIYRDGGAPPDAEVRRLADEVAQKYGVETDLVLKLGAEVRATYDHERSQMERAMAFVANGDYAQAAALLSDVVSKRPTNAWALANLCTAYLRLQRRADALNACDQAVRSGADNWLAHYNIATVRVADGQKNEALRELQIALDLVTASTVSGMTRRELVKQMKADAALSVLRNDPLFSKLTQVH